MPYELHLDGRHVATFDTTDQALAKAREATQQSAESEIEIRDAATKQPVMPGASRSWREHLARTMGY